MREILEQWIASRDDGKPFVLAINEWPLYVLQRLAVKTGFTPVAEALRQVTVWPGSSSRSTARPTPSENVVVVDLSLRNLLSASVVERVDRSADPGPLLRRARTPPIQRSPTATRCANRRSASGWSRCWNWSPPGRATSPCASSSDSSPT